MRNQNFPISISKLTGEIFGDIQEVTPFLCLLIGYPHIPKLALRHFNMDLSLRGVT